MYILFKDRINGNFEISTQSYATIEFIIEKIVAPHSDNLHVFKTAGFRKRCNFLYTFSFFYYSSSTFFEKEIGHGLSPHFWR